MRAEDFNSAPVLVFDGVPPEIIPSSKEGPDPERASRECLAKISTRTLPTMILRALDKLSPASEGKHSVIPREARPLLPPEFPIVSRTR